MTDKEKILQLIIKQLEARYEAVKTSALDAKDAATNEESKAENKYDTRGLEASYLAGAQAKRTEELKESIFHLKKITKEKLIKSDKIGLFSLVTLADEDGLEKIFFILPAQGGLKITFNENMISTLTLSSPLGMQIFNKQLEDEVILKTAKKPTIYEIVELF